MRPTIVDRSKRYKEKSLAGVNDKKIVKEKMGEKAVMVSSNLFKLSFNLFLIRLVIPYTDAIFIDFCA